MVYEAGNGNFTTNGDCILFPTECTVEAKINGSWELSITCPIDDEGRYKYITEGAVIAAPTFVGPKQLFRLYEVERTLDDVSGRGRPIFYDSADDVVLLDNRPTDKSGQQALNWIMSGTVYSGSSNIARVTSATYIRKNLIEALLGDDENSFINRWGGEASFNNYTVTINSRLGSDKGVIVAYKKNITAMQENVSLANTITRIIPVGYNGRMLSGDSPWVDSEKINLYPKIMARVVKFDRYIYSGDLQGEPQEGDHVYETVEALQTALASACLDMYDNGADDPEISIDIDMVDLSITDEYSTLYKNLESVTLGDTVHCYHSILGIETEARVVQIEWNCCTDSVSEITLGTQPKTYFDNVTKLIEQVGQVLDSSGQLVADRVRGSLDLARVQLRLQQNVAEHSDVRAILFEDLDPNSQTYGALCIGTQGIEIAHTRTNNEWDWGTAIDAKTIYADQMVSGLLSDQYGTNYWNLDTGEFRLGSSTYIDADGEVKTLEAYVSDLSAQVDGFILYLSTDFTGVSPAQDGTVTNCSTQASVYYGTRDVTSDCTWSVSASSGVTGTWAAATHTYTVSNLLVDEGVITITAVYGGVLSATKKFKVSSVTRGEAGQSFQIEATDDVIRIKDQYGRPNVDSVTFTGYVFTGTSLERDEFAGRWKIEATPDGGSYETVYQSVADEVSCEYHVTGLLADSDDYALVDDDGYGLLTGEIDDSAVRVTLYAPGGFDYPIATKNVAFIREAEALTTEQCFNILTNNGEAHGIIRTGNQLYISMDYLASGTVRTGLLKSADNENYWNLDTGEMRISQSTQVGDTTLEALAGEIALKISSDDAQTLITASADAIRMKTGALVWEASNSSLTSNGVLSTITDGRTTQMSGGRIKFFNGDTLTGMLEPLYITGKKGTVSYGYEGVKLTCASDAKCLGIGVQGHTSPAIIVNNGMQQYDEDVIFPGSVNILENHVGIEYVDLLYLEDVLMYCYKISMSTKRFLTVEAGVMCGDSASLPRNYSAYQLVVGGNGGIDGYLHVTGSINNSSDERLKAIEEWPDELDEVVMELEPIAFRWKADGSDLYFGLGAQTTRKAFEDHGIDPQGFAPYYSETDSYGVSYQQLAPILLKTIQKDRKRIEELEDRVTALEEMVRKLTERIDNG